MEDLSDYSSEVVEFKPTNATEKEHQQQRMVDNSSNTDSRPAGKDASTETTKKNTIGFQTDSPTVADAANQVDDEKLAQWLNRICPFVEAELERGPTPFFDFCGANSANDGALMACLKIQIYQKITVSAVPNSQGLAIWLSVHTNDAPVLVLSTTAPHDGWCEHINQSLKVFVPKRVPNSGNFVLFTEVKSLPLKACLKTLCTNSYDKTIFAGSTMDGDVYVWQYKQGSGNGIELEQLFTSTSSHGYATAMHWATKNRLFTTYADGWISQWLIVKEEMLLEIEFLLKPAPNTSNEISAIICLGLNEFVVGTKDGGVYYCWRPLIGATAELNEIDVIILRKHNFMVTTLRKVHISGCAVVISCDLSGQLFYHDLQNADDETRNIIVQIPLPFKNAIEYSPGADVVYSPGDDGALECYRVRDGEHSTVKGALRGKGNIIKCSKNGFWIITGLYTNDFQIFYVDKDGN